MGTDREQARDARRTRRRVVFAAIGAALAELPDTVNAIADAVDPDGPEGRTISYEEAERIAAQAGELIEATVLDALLHRG